MVPKTERFEMRFDEETLARIDGWRGEQDSLPSRAEAIRQLIEAGLTRVSRNNVQFSDGEKLLLVMMRDLFKRLGMEQDADVDAEFIAQAIYGGHYWAPKWRMAGVFHDHADDPRNLHYVVDVLDMWSFIERGFEQLSKAEKAKLAVDAAPFGERVRFPGFDGNNESEELGIAGFLIKKMDRFPQFKDRDLNSHFPTRAMHTRMLRLFESMRETLIGQELNAAQITALMGERVHPDRR